MGIVSDAFTIIGFKIKKQDLIIESTGEHKLCDCDFNSIDYKFCPSCGVVNKIGTFIAKKYIVDYTKYMNADEDESDEYENEEDYNYDKCDCNLNSVDYKYCLSCGMPNNFETYLANKNVVKYSDDKIRDIYDNDEEYGNLMINDTNYKTLSIYNSGDMYITIHISSCHSNTSNFKYESCPLSLETLCELKQKLMKDLCTIDLWKNDVNFINNFNKNFKIYTLSAVCPT